MSDSSLSKPSLEMKIDSETFTQKCLSTPFIIDGALSEWPAREWTVNSLAQILAGKDLRCRLMPRDRKSKGEPAWESEGVYIDCQLKDFSAWCQGEASQDNPLRPFSPCHFSAYIDYKYMSDVFSGSPELLKEVQWKSLGLNNMDGSDSTLWVGSTGASTPCHYDTYGFNLVAQIQGRKQWVLFPPKAGRGMYPTRVPYEESSVFSQIDLSSPDLSSFPEFKKLQPIVTTLEPGQVLYVPRQWWHYVTCIETAVSINTWVEVPEDNAGRLQEAVTRVLASSLIPYLAQTAGPTAEDDWINPTEELQAAAVNIEYLKSSLSIWKQSMTGKLATENMSGGGEENTGNKVEQAVIPLQEDSICDTTIKAGISLSDSNQTSGQKGESVEVLERESLPESYWASLPPQASTGFTKSWPEGIKLLQLAKTLQHCPSCYVSSPFSLSHHFKRNMDFTTSSSVSLNIKTSSVSFSVTEQENKSTDCGKRKRKNVHADVSDEIETGLSVCNRIPQKLCKKDTDDANITESVSPKGDGGETPALLEKLRSNSSSAFVKMSVFVPKTCRLQDYLALIKQDEDEASHKEDYGKASALTSSRDTREGIAPHQERENVIVKEKEGVTSCVNENHGRNTETEATGSLGTGCDSVQAALLRSVMQPHVIMSILEELVKQV